MGNKHYNTVKHRPFFFGTHDLEKNKTQPAGMTSPED
jgi:hypothetical protein